MHRYWAGAAIMGMLIPLGGGVAYAQDSSDGWTNEVGRAAAKPADNGGAQIITGKSCKMREDPSGSPFIFTTDMQAVVTPSGPSGQQQVNLVCHDQLPPGTVAPFNQSGFPCSVGPAGTTTDSHIVWTPSGQGTITCHGVVTT